MPLIPSSDTLVISSYSRHWEELAKYTCASHKKYCETNGYDYHVDRSDLVDSYYDPVLKQHERLPIKGFVKIDLFLHFLPQYKRVVWIDADALVTNRSIKIEQLLHPNHPIVMPFDWNGHNATVIICESTPLVWDFWWAVNNTGRKLFLKHDWVEMEASRYFSQTPPYNSLIWYESVKKLCGILPKEYEAAGVPLRMSEQYGWLPGDWILHFSALSLERRIELAKHFTEALKL